MAFQFASSFGGVQQHLVLQPESKETRPPFPAYLLPSFSFSRPSTMQRRKSSTTSVRTSISSITSAVFSLASLSPTSSANTTPSSSPSEPSYFNRRDSGFVSFPDFPKEYTRRDEEVVVPAVLKLKRTQPDTLKCACCATDIAFVDQIVSKGFTGRHGRAYLVSPPPPRKSTFLQKIGKSQADKDKEGNLINIKVGRPVNRQLVTGAHVVADISCVICSTVIGWKYVDAKEAGQRYKIGKFILETKRVVSGKTWEDVPEDDGMDAHEETVKKEDEIEDEIVFDSDDEDECDDLFSGTWDAEVVAKRRLKKIGVNKK